MSTNDIYIDKALLELITEGNEISSRYLFDNFHKPVFNQAYSYLHSSELANKVVQEVFVKIWKVREKLPEIKDFKSYIFIIVRNIMINAGDVPGEATAITLAAASEKRPKLILGAGKDITKIGENQQYQKFI